MEQIEKIVDQIVNLNKQSVNVTLKGLQQVNALEELLNKRKIPFVMEITLTDIECRVKISKRDILYEEGVHELNVKESENSYDADIKKIPIGMSDFRNLRLQNNQYIDKTKMIEMLLDSGDEVTLITRPRRFGKTLNKMCIRDRIVAIFHHLCYYYTQECAGKPVIILYIRK